MKTPSDEYAFAVDFLGTVPHGRELIHEVTAFSRFLGNAAYELFEGKKEPPQAFLPFFEKLLTHDVAKMAFCFLGKQGVADIIEKNLILFLSRFFSASRAVDILPLHDKLSFFVQSMTILSSQSFEWTKRLEESSLHIHDKKERRHRRHHLQHDLKHRIVESHPLRCEKVLRNVLSVLLPNGASSLYLPPGGELFIPKLQEMVDSAIPSCAVWIVETLFRRELKVDGLYYVYTQIPVWVTKEASLPVKSETAEPPSDLVASLTSAIPYLRQAFFPRFDSPESFATPDIVAFTLIDWIGLLLQRVSLESLLASGCIYIAKMTSISFTNHSDRELDQVIETLSNDERIVRAIIKKIFPSPDLPAPKRRGAAAVFFELVMYGLKASASELLAKGTLATSNWEEIQHDALERIRWFVLSPYFDQALLEIGNRVKGS